MIYRFMTSSFRLLIILIIAPILVAAIRDTQKDTQLEVHAHAVVKTSNSNRTHWKYCCCFAPSSYVDWGDERPEQACQAAQWFRGGRIYYNGGECCYADEGMGFCPPTFIGPFPNSDGGWPTFDDGVQARCGGVDPNESRVEALGGANEARMNLIEFQAKYKKQLIKPIVVVASMGVGGIASAAGASASTCTATRATSAGIKTCVQAVKTDRFGKSFSHLQVNVSTNALAETKSKCPDSIDVESLTAEDFEALPRGAASLNQIVPCGTAEECCTKFHGG